MFNLGYAIVEVAGDFKVLMERASYFYQDVEIDYFPVIDNNSWEVFIDKGLIANQIKVGYKEYPKSTDENKNNNVDEFNTVQEVLTPITTIKKKLEYESELIGSGYKIENQRIEQFSLEQDTTITDDDKLFVIKGIDSDTYEVERLNEDVVDVIFTASYVISLYGNYFDLKADDLFTISLDDVASSNEGTYTVSDI